MSDRPAPRTYEITWQSGHIESVIAHQVSWPRNAANLFAGANKPPVIQFHAEIEGIWALQLSAHEDDIRTIRDVTSGEVVAPDVELGGES